jgi:hypothetical protein
MDKQITEQIRMKLGVRTYLNQNAAITASIPNYTTLFGNFSNCVDVIQQSSEQTMMFKTASAEQKTQIREALLNSTIEIGTRLRAYASFTKAYTLSKELDFSDTSIRRMTDIKLKDYAQLVYDRAYAIVTTLAVYGITAANLSVMLTRITAFNGYIPKQKNQKSEKVVANNKLSDDIDKAKQALLLLDTAVACVKLTQPQFYEGYLRNRKLTNPPTQHFSLRFKGIDAQTKQPIPNLMCKIVLNSVNGAPVIEKQKPLIRRTAAKGNAIVRSLSTGTYTAEIYKEGYNSEFVNFVINDNETTKLEVELNGIHLN